MKASCTRRYEREKDLNNLLIAPEMTTKWFRTPPEERKEALCDEYSADQCHECPRANRFGGIIGHLGGQIYGSNP